MRSVSRPSQARGRQWRRCSGASKSCTSPIFPLVFRVVTWAFQALRSSYRTIRRLGEECLSAEPGARPTMEDVQRRLEKLHEKLLVRANSMDLSHFRALSCPS